MLNFIGTCDKFRTSEVNELIWQEMMKTKKRITESEFLKLCDVTIILDYNETWSDYKQNAKMQNDPIKFYKSNNGLYFFQKSGFEFIWS